MCHNPPRYQYNLSSYYINKIYQTDDIILIMLGDLRFESLYYLFHSYRQPVSSFLLFLLKKNKKRRRMNPRFRISEKKPDVLHIRQLPIDAIDSTSIKPFFS